MLPEFRRLGAAAALVSAVREAALEAGATRLSLVTEPDNQAALGLYRKLGFRPVEGLASLSLDLASAVARNAPSTLPLPAHDWRRWETTGE